MPSQSASLPPTAPLAFCKMTAAGNDFLCIDNSDDDRTCCSTGPPPPNGFAASAATAWAWGLTA